MHTPTANPAKTDYLDTISKFACETRYEDIPKHVIEHCKLLLADTFAVIGCGMQQKEMQALTARQLPKVASGRASVIGTGKRVNAFDAAMLNAIAGVWLELDEGHFYTNGHPGIHVIPASFAHAQEHGFSGKDLLLAFVLGYEICGRIGGAYKMRVIVQTHGTFGVIGATVAVAKLCGFNQSQMRQAINIAASTPLGGNRQTMLDGATIRNYYPGHANFTAQIADDFKPDKAAAELGTRWLVTENYFKLYPSARYVHCGIDALLDALSKVPGKRLPPESVDRVELYGYRMLIFCGETRPKSMFGTRFSTPFSIGTILYHGRSDLDVFGEQAFANPAVLDLAARVKMIEVPEMNKDFPRKMPARIKIFLKDGTVYEGKCDVPKGELENPHVPAELERKYYQLATPIWGEERARKAYQSWMTLETLDNVRDFAGGDDY
ncbi:MAG: MmgE/PrpD family protein [Betaproteobacteria bacterium]|nr:MmgE/PrpD family protein [Betaproteobacteria bacterium]